VRRSSAFEDVVGWVSLGTGMKQSIASPFFFFRLPVGSDRIRICSSFATVSVQSVEVFVTVQVKIEDNSSMKDGWFGCC